MTYKITKDTTCRRHTTLKPRLLLLWFQLVMLILMLGTETGCSRFKSWFKKKPELNAEENYLQGMKKFEDEDYDDAILYFQKILENFPFSIHAI